MQHNQVESNRYYITMKFFFYFMAMFLLIRVSQYAFWISYIILPFILWVNNIHKFHQKHFYVTDRMIAIYFTFGCVIFITALFSPYGMKTPFARFITVISLCVFFKLSFIEIKSREYFIYALDGVIVAGLIYLFILYATSFNGFAFMLDDDESKSIYGNKNTAGNIIFLIFNLTIIRSNLCGKKWIFFVFSTFLMISTIFTISLKCAVASFAIYCSYLFFIRKEFSFFIRLSFLILFIVLIPSIVITYNYLLDSSPELQILADKFNMMVGNEDAALVQYGFVEDREMLIRRTWKLFLDSPIFGVGLENSRVVYETYSHNTYVEILAGGGILLIIPFILFLWTELRYLLKQWKQYSFLLIIFACVIYISNALRIYDDIEYLFLLFALIKSKQYMIQLSIIKQ